MTLPTPTGAAAPPLELWGGVECTINRVRDTYFRQLDRNGHARRPGDLERFAGLGLRAIRYPVLWEQCAPGRDPAAVDWRWADERLPRLRELGVRPIVGLVHHGSGPAHTSLVDPGFARGLAAYAGRVAERFPWVEEWTPVNEPLTTARFSTINGVWYPHLAHDPAAFARAVVTQCEAVRLAMRAVRRVNPAARLVQTEDLGRVWATAAVAREAELQNERRWLSFDLLCGRVDREHPFWPLLTGWGIGERELEAFVDEPCPPDVMGINHYLTSDRFLDDRVERYPDRWHDHADGVTYVDVEAVRACPECPVGVGPRLREAWARYGIPLAVTESHLGCTREEQMRWLLETWRSAATLRREGVDVRAVTVWSLLGAFDWNSLVTCDGGYYEPGPFDVRGPTPGTAPAAAAPPPPRETALAVLTRQLARGDAPDHPLLEHPGWWRRPDRLCYPAAQGRAWRSYAAPLSSGAGAFAAFGEMRDRGGRPLLITGSTGTLGQAFQRLCDIRGIPYHALTRADLDVTDADAVHAAVAALRPWAVVNCAGWVRVDDAEREPEACMRANALAPALLAAACARAGARLAAFSSDLVFDGVEDGRPRERPYVESDRPAPLNVYGRSKAVMEERVLDVAPSALVVRTSAFFGPWDAHNFVTVALRALARGEPFRATSDVTIAPTYVEDLVHATLDLLVDGESGIWHVANPSAVTWEELARKAARMAEISDAGIVPAPLDADPLPAARPRYSVLGSERVVLAPPLDHALARYFRHRVAPDDAGDCGCRAVEAAVEPEPAGV
jgi:dTDP-4-dehydrorhamnose reductase